MGRRSFDQLDNDVDGRESRSIHAERLSQHSLDSISIHCALQLTFADDQTKTSTALSIVGRIEPKASATQLNRSGGQDRVELPFLCEAILSRKTIDRGGLVTPRGVSDPLLCEH
jgi:hypothetical protein